LAQVCLRFGISKMEIDRISNRDEKISLKVGDPRDGHCSIEVLPQKFDTPRHTLG
jgi:hypothetical protein